MYSADYILETDFYLGLPEAPEPPDGSVLGIPPEKDGYRICLHKTTGRFYYLQLTEGMRYEANS